MYVLYILTAITFKWRFFLLSKLIYVVNCFHLTTLSFGRGLFDFWLWRISNRRRICCYSVNLWKKSVGLSANRVPAHPHCQPYWASHQLFWHFWALCGCQSDKPASDCYNVSFKIFPTTYSQYSRLSYWSNERLENLGFSKGLKGI